VLLPPSSNAQSLDCLACLLSTGIIIWMYRPDHPPPHFHAQYGEDVAQIELGTLRVLNGSLPQRALRLVRQ